MQSSVFFPFDMVNPLQIAKGLEQIENKPMNHSETSMYDE